MSDAPPNAGARTALITGAGRGIGAATARRLSDLGWNVALVDIAADDADAADAAALGYALASADDLRGAAAACSGPTITAEADVRDQSAVATAVSATVDRFGRIDAAVAAAGAIAGGPALWDTTDAVWEAMIGINLTGAFHLARAAIPHLLGNPTPRSGRFVAVASTAASVGLPQLAAYTAAKHGVAGLVRGLAADLGDTGVTANAVSPGSTATAMLDASAAIYGLDSRDAFSEHARIGRLLEPTEVAAAITWLCSADASGITGSVVNIDGGFSG